MEPLAATPICGLLDKTDPDTMLIWKLKPLSREKMHTLKLAGVAL